MVIADTSYLYDGSFDGFLTLVFLSYQTKQQPTAIYASTVIQTGLLEQLIEISTNSIHATRVARGIKRTAGNAVWELITFCFLSHHAKKDLILFDYIGFALKHGKATNEHLHAEPVAKAMELYSHVKKEAERWYGFIRFAKMETGFYYAAFQPQNSVVPVITPHFVARFADQAFLIHDTIHHIVGVYDLTRWYLVATEQVLLPEYSADELLHQHMWQNFCQTISIPERRNKHYQQTQLPNCYRFNMPEFINQNDLLIGSDELVKVSKQLKAE